MLRELTAEQLKDWMAYDELEPIGGKRGDWQAASIVAAMHSLQRNPERFPEPFPPGMFLLEFDRPERKVEPRGRTWQEMRMMAQVYVAGQQMQQKRR